MEDHSGAFVLIIMQAINALSESRDDVLQRVLNLKRRWPMLTVHLILGLDAAITVAKFLVQFPTKRAATL